MDDSAAHSDAGDNGRVNTAAGLQPMSLTPRADGEEGASRQVLNEQALKHLVDLKCMDVTNCKAENCEDEFKEHARLEECHNSLDECPNVTRSANKNISSEFQDLHILQAKKSIQTNDSSISPKGGLNNAPTNFCHEDDREMEQGLPTADEMEVCHPDQKIAFFHTASAFEASRGCDRLDCMRDSSELRGNTESSCDSTCLITSQDGEGVAQCVHVGDRVKLEEEIMHEERDLDHPYTGGLTLDQLDDDVIFHIASFLEARIVKYALSQVCQRFQAMFDNEAYWKMRITVRWPKNFPAVQYPDFSWVDACVEREDCHRVWSDPSANTDHFMYSCNVFGEVDAVHLMNEGQIVVSGDRNRILNFIDLTKYPGPGKDESQMKDMLIHSNRTVHQGWIWSIASVRNKVITGSWDTWVRMFDVEAGCDQVADFKLKSAVLSLYAEENEIVASCFDKKVYFIDPRSPTPRSRTFHTKPVLCVTGDEKFIISGSEDKSISIYDRRGGKIFMMFKQLDSYPMCLSYHDNQLWFGDKTGVLHLHDGTEDVFECVGSYDIGHTEKMTGVINTRGAIFTCSGDRRIKILHPTKDPDPISTINIHAKEIANIDYNSGVLVSAGGDDCIGVWLPKHWERNTYLL